jgi:hypothetical protein
MFGGMTKVLAEGVGAADNCSVVFGKEAIIAVSEYQAFLLPDETPQILLKCIKGEYIFTDIALTIVFGEAAAGRKRNVNRFEYRVHRLKNVSFETFGTLDNDCSLAVVIGDFPLGIDVKKNEQASGITVYRVLQALAAVQETENRTEKVAIAAFTSSLGSSLNSDPAVMQNMVNVAIYGADSITNRYSRRSYKEVFEGAGLK